MTRNGPISLWPRTVEEVARVLLKTPPQAPRDIVEIGRPAVTGETCYICEKQISGRWYKLEGVNALYLICGGCREKMP